VALTIAPRDDGSFPRSHNANAVDMNDFE